MPSNFLLPSDHFSWCADDYEWDDVRLVASDKREEHDYAGRPTSNCDSDDGTGSASVDWPALGVAGAVLFEGTPAAGGHGKYAGHAGQEGWQQKSGGVHGVRVEVKPGPATEANAAATSGYVGVVVNGHQSISPRQRGSRTTLVSRLNSTKFSGVVSTSIPNTGSTWSGGGSSLQTNRKGGATGATGSKSPPWKKSSSPVKEDLSSGLSDGNVSGGGSVVASDFTSAQERKGVFPTHRPKGSAAVKRGSTRCEGTAEKDSTPEKYSTSGVSTVMHCRHVKTNLSCRIDGCAEICDKAYTARSRVCLKHMQALSTEIEGESKRFCQKCTRFHPVDLFEGTHRTCTEQLIKRQLKAKRPRKLNRDGGPKTQGAESTPLDTEKSLIPSKTTTKRRRASKASTAAAANAPAVTVDHPELHEYTAAVADSPVHLVHRSARSVKMLVNEVTRDMLEECGEKVEERELPELFPHHASGMAGAEANVWREAGGLEDIVGRNAFLESARSTFLESTTMPTDDAFTPLDPSAHGCSQQHHDSRRMVFPRLPFDDVERAMMGWMGAVEHQHQHPPPPPSRPPPPPPPPQQQQQRRQHDGVDCGDDSSQYEHFLRIMGGIEGERYEPLTHAQTHTNLEFRDHDAADVAMPRQVTLMQQHPGSDANNLQGSTTSLTHTHGHVAGFHTSDIDAAGFPVIIGQDVPRFHPPAPPGRRESDDLDMLTLWAKLDGFAPNDFPSQGLAGEVHRWLRQKITGAISGHIQPGCTLLTVDCMLPLADTSQIRTDGIHALAETLLAGPLGMRGDVTVGMGPEALLCVADRDAATGEIIPGSFSQKMPLKAANLMPGGAEAARACAASLKSHQTHRAHRQDLNHIPQPQFLRVYPSGVFTGGRSESERNARDTGNARGARMSQPKTRRFPGVQTSLDDEEGASMIPSSTVRVTFPAAALHGCSLRCRANGRTVPVSIVSAFKSVTTFSSSAPPREATSAEAITLVVKIEATGIDGVAMLELVRSDRGAEDVLGNKCGGASQHPQHDRLSGVPAGLPAMPVLLISDREVHASLAEVLALNENEQNTFGRHASTLYALGATMRGQAPPRQAFQSACWAASMGKMGGALMLRLLELYPAASIITSAEDAATLLLHATASGDSRTVLTALYHGRVAAEVLGFDADEIARIPVGAAGETPLHRAAAMHESGGDADVMCELLATLSKPLAWSMSSPGRKPRLMGSLLFVEAVGAATATLVRVARRHPPSASDGDTLAGLEIIQEAISTSPSPATFTPRESARAAITLEILRSPSSSTRLLNVAAHFNAVSSNRPKCGGGGGGGVFHAPGHEVSPLSPSSLFPIETVEHEFIADALRRWPTLGCGSTMEARSSDLFYRIFREGAVESLKQFGKVKSWLAEFGPNGDGSLFFDTDPKLERIWMDYRAKIQWTVDHAAFTFLVSFQIVSLIRFHLAPSLQSFALKRFDWSLVLMLLCHLTYFLIFQKFPGWYARHRETIIFMTRITLPLYPIHKIFAFHAVSPFLRNMQFITLNLFTTFYPVRADRHLFIQIMNTITYCLLGRGHTYTWANLPLRSSLAAASLVVTLMQEVHSRRAFALEHQKAMAAQQSRFTKGVNDWFLWGVNGDDFVKPATMDPGGKHEQTDATKAEHK